MSSDRLGRPGLIADPVDLGVPGLLGCRATRLSARTVDLDRRSSNGAVSGTGPGLAARDLSRRETASERSQQPAGLSLARRLARLLQPPLESFLDSPCVVEWPHPFFEYQRDGIRELVARDTLLLADDMGLGKTVQAVAGLRVLFRTGRVESALLVVPAGLILQWRRALREWAPELRTSTIRGTAAERTHQWQAPVHVHITSYETLRSDFGRGRESPPRRRIWDVVMLDEAQRIKNRESEVSRICKRLPRRRAWALTGTPLENRIDDLASICEFLRPWQDGDGELRLSRGAALLDLHRTLQLRRRKSDVLAQLPPKTAIEIALRLTGEQRTSYDRAEREGILRLRGLGEEVRITHVLELITRLKQICNSCPATGDSAKLDDVEARIETLSAEGHKALVFSQYAGAHGVREIVARLAAFDPVSYTGALSGSERDSALAAFRSDPARKVLVLSLRAGGQGLNLQEASYVFHFDRWWNPAVENQAEDRSHRLGQQSPVTVYRYICEATIEERIASILRAKQALFDRLVDDVSIDLERHLTAAELFGLFDLEPPRAGRSPLSEPPAETG